MGRTRLVYPEYPKVMIALETVKSIQTMGEHSATYGVYAAISAQIYSWRSRSLDAEAALDSDLPRRPASRGPRPRPDL